MKASATVQIFYTRRPETFEQAHWKRLLSMMPPAARSYILNFHRPEDRQDRLLARLLLRKALIDIDYPATLEDLKYDRNQRPFISREIDFNFSHSGNLVLCAISTCTRVGIDTEKITPVNFSDIIGPLPPGIEKKIRFSPNPQKKFFDTWTLRESILKADGRGLALPQNYLKIQTNGYFIDQHQYFPVKFSINQDYSCHLATNIRENDFYLHQITFPFFNKPTS